MVSLAPLCIVGTQSALPDHVLPIPLAINPLHLLLSPGNKSNDLPAVSIATFSTRLAFVQRWRLLRDPLLKKLLLLIACCSDRKVINYVLCSFFCVCGGVRGSLLSRENIKRLDGNLITCNVQVRSFTRPNTGEWAFCTRKIVDMCRIDPFMMRGVGAGLPRVE